MDLIKELREIKKNRNLDKKLLLKINCSSGNIVEGSYRGYTQAIDNEPEIASIEIDSKRTIYSIFENEIDSIEVI